MPSADLLIPFFVASALFACVPGPGMLYAAAQTLALGRRAGWVSALGFHLAGLGHVGAAAFGVSALLVLVPALFMVMKLLGAAYLIWLGLRYVRRPGIIAQPEPRRTVATMRRSLRDSIVVEVLNPKSVLFYLAFLPQFTDASSDFPIWAQIVILGAIVNFMFSVTDAILIELAHAVVIRLRSSRNFILTLQRVGGGILIALGINLLLARQQ